MKADIETKKEEETKVSESKPKSTEAATPKKVVAPLGLRRTGEILLRVCHSNSRPSQPAVYHGAMTSVGMPVNPRTRFFDFNGQTPEDIVERYPQLSRQMLIRTPQGEGRPDALAINVDFFQFGWNLNIPHHGLKLNLEIERDRFWASILEVCPEIGKKAQASNSIEKFHIVDIEGEADVKVGKGKLKHDAGVILYDMSSDKIERMAVLYGVELGSSTKNEQFAALQDGIDRDPQKFLTYVKNEEHTNYLIDVRLFVLNRLVNIDEYNSYTLDGTLIGTTEDLAAKWFMQPANQSRYLMLKTALKGKLLKEA